MAIAIKDTPVTSGGMCRTHVVFDNISSHSYTLHLRSITYFGISEGKKSIYLMILVVPVNLRVACCFQHNTHRWTEGRIYPICILKCGEISI